MSQLRKSLFDARSRKARRVSKTARAGRGAVRGRGIASARRKTESGLAMTAALKPEERPFGYHNPANGSARIETLGQLVRALVTS